MTRIVGNGTYNRPFKLEMKDPLMTKTIDHLKTVVADNKAYLKEFEVPLYILEKVEQRDVSSHLLEYYFCALNGLLKCLSCYDLQHRFKRSLEKICDFLEQANVKLLDGSGYILRLELIVEKNLQKRKKMDIIPVLLHPSAVRDGAINFIYKLCNTLSNDVSFSLRLTIDKLKANFSTRAPQTENFNSPTHSKKKSKIFGFLYRQNSSISQKSASSLPESDVENEKEISVSEAEDFGFESPVNRSTRNRISKKISSNRVIAIKDSYINELMRQEAKQAVVEINFEHLESIYIRKSTNFLQNNLIVRFLSRYIYKQHYSKGKQGHLPGLIFLLLTIEIVSFRLFCLTPRRL